MFDSYLIIAVFVLIFSTYTPRLQW